MQNDLEIIRNIAQAAANITYDGATDEKYVAHDLGMQRDEGNPLLDSRTIDGFQVRIAGNNLIVSYSVEQRLSDVYAQKIEQEMEAIIAQCVNYLKGEYRKISGKNLKLTKVDEIDVRVQYISRIRTSINAACVYRIGSLKEVSSPESSSEDTLNDTFKKFLSMGRDDASNPMNITRKDT